MKYVKSLTEDCREWNGEGGNRKSNITPPFPHLVHLMYCLLSQLQSRGKLRQYCKHFLRSAWTRFWKPVHTTASFQERFLQSFCETPRRQDVWKTEVCLTDTYTTSACNNYPFSCASTQKCRLQHKHALFHTPALFSWVWLHSPQSWSEKGTKGTGGQAWWKFLMALWGPAGPDTSSLTRITGNPDRKWFHTTGPLLLPPEKQKVTKSLLCRTLHPLCTLENTESGAVCVYFPHPIAMSWSFLFKTKKEQTDEK